MAVQRVLGIVLAGGAGRRLAPLTAHRPQAAGLVRNSIPPPGTRINSRPRVDRAVILHNSRVSRHAVVQDAIFDENVTVQEGATVGVDKTA